ncbi:MAG TPA: class I SAM-dependent methyltransferase [Gemmatimonadales bacterium]|jgi:SAM-dependent methyltransferase|nr:class I SAM-dependent methyltransferase [Gemmatimonadales bacterium]
MNPETRPAPGAERERLRAAYARRSNDDRRYSWFEPGHLFLMQERERAVLRALSRHGLEDLQALRILEIGCGDANWLRDLVRWGARPERLVGVDVLPERLGDAVKKGPPETGIAQASGEELPFPPETFDLVIQSTVFTSILDQTTRIGVAREMMRVLRPGGSVLWYDFHVPNPGNPDVQPVGRGELRRLFPGSAIDLHRVTLAPPIARRVARWSWLAGLLLARIPLLRTHSLALITKSR